MSGDGLPPRTLAAWREYLKRNPTVGIESDEPFICEIRVKWYNDDPGYTAYAMGLSRHHAQPDQAVSEVVRACRALLESWRKDGIPRPRCDSCRCRPVVG